MNSMHEWQTALLDASGLYDGRYEGDRPRLDRFIGRTVQFVVALGNPYRSRPPRRQSVEGALCGLRFNRSSNDDAELEIFVEDTKPPHHQSSLFFDGKTWLWREAVPETFGWCDDVIDFPGELGFPDDPLIAAGKIIKTACPQWQSAMRRFFIDGDAEKVFLDHLVRCETCGDVVNKIFAITALDFSAALDTIGRALRYAHEHPKGS